MEKFISGGLETFFHGLVTYCVVGKNKATVIDEGNDDIEIVREDLRLSPEQCITRLKITNISGTMMKLINAYQFISDKFAVEGISSAEWSVFNDSRQINDVPAVCMLGKRNAAFRTATDRLSEEGLMLKSLTNGDAVLSGDGITIIKAGRSCIALEMLSQDSQLTDISMSVDCNGSLKAVRAGGEYNCLLEPGDIKITDWVRICTGGNYHRLTEDYAAHRYAVHSNQIHVHERAFVYALTGKVTRAGFKEKLDFLAHIKAPFDYFEIGDGWQNNCGDWEAAEGFSQNMQLEAEEISRAGFKAGIRTAPFIADRKSELFQTQKRLFLRHADGSVCMTSVNGREYAVLDVSSPEALEWLEMTYKRISAYGYYFHDVALTNVFMLQKDVILANPTVTAVEAYAAAVSVIKDAIGEAGYLHITEGFAPPLAGIADSVCICSSPQWNSYANRGEKLPSLINQVVYRSHMNMWWHNSCGSILGENVFSRLNAAELRCVLVCEYMCAGTVIVSDFSSNDELKLLRAIAPAVKTKLCNRCMFTEMPYVSTVDVEVNGDYHTLCFINQSSDEVNIIFRLDNKTCGGYVDHSSKYDISSFFDRKRLRGAQYDDVVRLGKIAPGSAEIVKIIKTDKPHILLSDMHMSMGGEVDVTFDGDAVTVSGCNLFNCMGNYLVALPEGCACDGGQNEFSFTVNGSGKFSYKKAVRKKSN